MSHEFEQTSWQIKGVHNVDFLAMVRAGYVSGWSSVLNFGLNESIGTTEEPIWSQGGPVPYPDTPQTLTLSSDNPNDTVAGTGARTVEVEVINALGELDIVVVSMLGTTAVTIPTSDGSNTGFFCNRLKVLTVGGPGPYNGNLGNIYAGYGAVVAGVPDSILNSVNANSGSDMHGRNQSLQGIFWVPKDIEAFIIEFFSTVKRNADVDISIYVKTPGSVFQIKGMAQTVSGSFDIPVKAGGGIPGGSIIETRSLATAGGGRASTIMQLLLRKTK